MHSYATDVFLRSSYFSVLARPQLQQKNGGKERPFAAMVGYFWPALDRSDRVVVVGWPLSNKNNDAKKDIQYAGRGAKEITAARADFWRKWRPRKK